MPKSKSGRWSLILIIVVTLLFLGARVSMNTFYSDVSSGDTILADIVGRPLVALPMLAGMMSGIAAFVMGLMAIVKQKDRSILVVVSTLLGAFILLFVVGEIVFPH